MRTEAQLLASALYDDTPEMPVAHLRLSASWLSRIQTVYRNAWALCGAAHLNNLKAFDKRVLDRPGAGQQSSCGSGCTCSHYSTNMSRTPRSSDTTVTSFSDFAPLSGFAGFAFTCVVVNLAPEPDFIGLHHASSCKNRPGRRECCSLQSAGFGDPHLSCAGLCSMLNHVCMFWLQSSFDGRGA